MSPDLFIGVDLGGTQLRLAAVTIRGELASPIYSAPTGASITPEQFTEALQQLWSQIKSALPAVQFHACGVGVAGVIRHGQLAASDNVPLLVGPQLNELFRVTLDGLAIAMENDARCFLLGEARFGAGRGALNACGITLGTGVGGAVMVNGKLLTGVNSEAGEIWRVPCRETFIEYFVSGAGLVRGYLAAGGQNTASLTAAEVAERARNNDQAALQAWQAYGNDVYALCETMIALLEPEVIILGGSMAGANDLFGAQFHEKLANRATRIALAELDAAAGVIGAAALQF